MIFDYSKSKRNYPVVPNESIQNTFSMIPMTIPDHAFVKRKVFLAQDAGNDYQAYL